MELLNLSKFGQRVRQANLLSHTGVVVSVSGLSIEAKGPNVGIGHMCQILQDNGKTVLAEVVGFRQENRILIPLDTVEGVAPNNIVRTGGGFQTIRVSDSILGRVVDGLGRPIDSKGPVRGEPVSCVNRASPPPLSRQRITEPISLGVRTIDGLFTCGKGQRIGIFSGSGLGKSSLLGAIARFSEADVNVLALVGERGREVKQFLEESLGPEGLAKSVVVVSTADSSPVHRVKASFTAVTIAEYFRAQGKHVLFMMDSLTRLAHAQREIGLAAGEPPTTKGYCPSVFGLIPRLTERLGFDHRGSITGIFSVLVDSDDMSDPIADCVRSLLDGHLVLTRKLAEQGHYPAIDILQSISRLMSSVASEEQLNAAQKLKSAYATYKSAEDLINIGAYTKGSNPRIDKSIALIEPIRNFLQQPIQDFAEMQGTLDQLLKVSDDWNFDISSWQPAKSA